MAKIWDTVKKESEEKLTIIKSSEPATTPPKELKADKIREVMDLLREGNYVSIRDVATKAGVKVGQVREVLEAMNKRLAEIQAKKESPVEE